MKTKKSEPCVVSVADHTGWAYVVCVAKAGDTPVVIERRRVTLIDEGLPTLAYHHDTVGMAEDEANALLARVRESIDRCTSVVMRQLVDDLAPEHTIVSLATRIPPFAELPDTVAKVRASYQMQNGADGVMYHLAMCRAARDLGMNVRLYRRGEETARAAEQLGVNRDVVEFFVTRTGRPAGPPWTQEHRRAFAAGIAALAVDAPGRLIIPTK